MKRLMGLVLLGCLLTGLSVAQDRWSAWVYNPDDGIITQILSTGEIAASFRLPLTQAFNAYGDHAVVSESGRFVAYTAYDNTVDRANQQLFVYDLVIGRISFAYELIGVIDTSLAYGDQQGAFADSAAQFALGMVDDQTWQIVIGSMNTSAVLTTLVYDPARLPEVSATAIPIVQRFNGASVWFSVGEQSFRWNLIEDTLTPDATYQMSDYLTGEIITLNESGGVDLIGLDGNAQTIYQAENGILQTVRFIQNGQQALITVQNADETRLVVIDRNGTLIGELSGVLDQIHATPDGFVGTFNSEGEIAIAQVITTGETLAPLTVWVGVNAPNLRLIHVGEVILPPTEPTFQD